MKMSYLNTAFFYNKPVYNLIDKKALLNEVSFCLFCTMTPI
ncbi:hypothetical protein EMIT079MI2_40113 [Bacillus sp. IT-79MI2]